MLLDINWMKKYVDIDITTRELADELTLSGSHVESIKDFSEGLENIVVGKVLEIEKHPDADKLVVTKIDVGSEILQIVTGAPNIEKDAYVMVALEGAVMNDGMKIVKSSLRGVESNGMCCSYQELGVADSLIPKAYKEGIVLLKGDFKVGTPIAEAIGFNDEVIELEITPNRPDCLSVIGMAREAAAAVDEKLEYPMAARTRIANEIEFSGAINTDKCDKLVVSAISDVVIEESPTWMQTYLMKSGIRPINNIVDITNYVMLEYGQPLHAYDLDKLSGKEIRVEEITSSESFTSLDGETRKLEEGDLVIRDGENIIALAGIMGGLDTEVTDSTKNILLESACFNKAQIRKTSARLGLRSEASSRFEKGVSPSFCLDSANRVSHLVEQLSAGRPSSNVTTIDKAEEEAIQVELRFKRTNELLGTDLSKEQMINYLERLEFKVDDKGETALVDIPSFRSDIEIEEDLIEEIGRIFGFHNIKPEALVGKLSKGKMSENKAKEYRLKNDLFALGYSEVLTYSFVSPKLNLRAGITDDELCDFIRLKNPLGEEFSVMRTSILPNHLEIISRNLNNNCRELSTFEIGNVFIKGDFDEIERRRLAITSFGDVDFYSFKADFLTLMSRAGIGDIEFIPRSDIDLYHAGRCAEMLVDGNSLGFMGEISYSTREEFSINKRVYSLEVDMDLINELTNKQITYKKIIKFPAIYRDLSIVVDKDVTHSFIKSLLLTDAPEILEGIRLADIYTGEQIDEDKKSLTYEIIYRAKDRTLVDKEVNKIQENIINILEENDIHLRK